MSERGAAGLARGERAGNSFTVSPLVEFTESVIHSPERTDHA